MYNSPGIVTGAGASSGLAYAGANAAGQSGDAMAQLAYTGLNVLWIVLAGFALIAAGTALVRIMPRSER